MRTTATIKSVKYKNTSKLGNNSYWVEFIPLESDIIIKGYTAPNAGSFTYFLEQYKDDKTILIIGHRTTKTGRVVIDSMVKAITELEY